LPYIDIDSPKAFNIWGIDDDIYFDDYDESLLLENLCYLPELIRLANCNKCTKHRIVYESMYEIVREAFRDRIDSDIKKLANILPQGSQQPELVKWVKYVNFLMFHYNSKPPIAIGDAVNLAKELTLNKIDVGWQTGSFRATGKLISGFHEIVYCEDAGEGYVDFPEFYYVNLLNSEWRYSFRFPLEIIDIPVA
jgi:hypothetical protein